MQLMPLRHELQGPARERARQDGTVLYIARLSSHRRVVEPFGAADGTVEEMTGTDRRKDGAGDVFVVETPGGSGCGEPEAADSARATHAIQVKAWVTGDGDGGGTDTPSKEADHEIRRIRSSGARAGQPVP